MSAVQSPVARILYNGKNITTDMWPYVERLEYRDRIEQESDELSIELNDDAKRWINAWYPEKGAKISLDFGYEGNMVPAGDFEIDEVNPRKTLSGRRVTIKALSAIVSQPLRTKHTYAYELISLEKLARTVAARNRLTVSGRFETINLERITQKNETDLAFLKRVSSKFGYVFSVKSGKLVFTKKQGLQERSPIKVLTEEDMSGWDINDATGRTYKVATQKYFDAAKGRSITFDKQIEDEFGGGNSKDKFVSEGSVENKQQAELAANARRLKILNSQVVGTVNLAFGQPLLLAGSNVEIEGIGKVSGMYAIMASIHTFSQSGYSTFIEISKIGEISPNRY